MKPSPVARLLLTIAVLAAITYGASAILYGRPPIMRDSFAYNASAQRLLNTGTYEYNSDLTASVDKTNGPSAFTMPGYTVFLAGIYAFLPHTGDKVANMLTAQMPIIVIQLLLAVASAVVMARTGYGLGGLKLGWTTGLMAVAYVPFGINATVAITEPLTLFLMCVLLLAVVELLRAKWSEEGGHELRWAVVYGVSGALSTLVRPTIAVWLLLPLAVCLLVNRRTTRAWRAPVLAALLVAALMAPWIVRNAVVLGRFVPLTDSSGVVLLSSVGGEPISEAEQKTFAAAEAANEDPYRAVAMERIKTQWVLDPVGFATSRLGKAWMAITEYVDLPNDILVDFQMSGIPPQGTFADAKRFMPIPTDGIYRAIYLAMTAYHRFLLTAALLGLLLGRRRAVIWTLASIPVYYVLVHTAVLVMLRYFYPVAPVLILLAAYGLLGAWMTVKGAMNRGEAT